MIEQLLPLGLGFIMFGLGLDLTLDDFRRALQRPRALLLGLIAQVVLLPLTAFTLAKGLGLSPEAAVGLMVLAACPGGVTAGMVTHLARGETALSISLSALTSLLAFVSVPLIIGASLWAFMGQSASVRVPVGQLAGGLVLVTLLPVSLGLWLRETERVTPKTRDLVQRLAASVFALIVLYTFFVQWPSITAHLPTVGVACLLLNLITMGTGIALGALARIDTRGRIALAVECGMQNSALGITLALTLLSEPALAVPSVVYALLMNITAFALIGWRALAPARSTA
ncbi:MAG: bile acid:sodium symporter family protein [Pseudomonadota bacterium]